MKKRDHKEYCQKCNEFTEYNVKKVNRTITVKEKTLNVEIYECYCAKCGEKVFVYDYEKQNDIIVYDAYKKEVGLLTSTEIKNIRRKRGMTQIELARFLSIGDKDITRYESGSIQNKCIDKMLRLVNDDSSYEEMARVFSGYSFSSPWFNNKHFKWDIDDVFYDDPYNNVLQKVVQRLIEEFEDKGVTKKIYGREKREEVPLA